MFTALRPGAQAKDWRRKGNILDQLKKFLDEHFATNDKRSEKEKSACGALRLRDLRATLLCELSSCI